MKNIHDSRYGAERSVGRTRSMEPVLLEKTIQLRMELLEIIKQDNVKNTDVIEMKAFQK